jgi:hypothetical protein
VNARLSDEALGSIPLVADTIAKADLSHEAQRPFAIASDVVAKWET